MVQTGARDRIHMLLHDACHRPNEGHEVYNHRRMKGLVLSGLPEMVYICVRLRDLAVPRMGRQKREPYSNRLVCKAARQNRQNRPQPLRTGCPLLIRGDGHLTAGA